MLTIWLDLFGSGDERWIGFPPSMHEKRKAVAAAAQGEQQEAEERKQQIANAARRSWGLL